MTNKEKLDKLVAEIKGLIGDYNIKTEKYRGMNEQAHQYYGGKRDALSEILKSIVPIQEEPKECMYSKDNYTDEDRKVLCEGCEEECEFNKKEYSVNNGLDLGCGVIWRDEEPVSEDLEEAAQEYTEKGSKCQEELDAFKAGANWQKQQMLAKAVDATVHIDAGGYPYIPQIELYDYDKDIPLAKEGDKYKVNFIKKI